MWRVYPEGDPSDHAEVRPPDAWCVQAQVEEAACEWCERHDANRNLEESAFTGERVVLVVEAGHDRYRVRVLREWTATYSAELEGG